VKGNALIAPPPDYGARLPTNGIYPQGRTMAFMGYSGNPARDLTNGFTVAGPVYGNQSEFLARCASNGWPAVAHVGVRVNFLDPKSAAALPGKAALRKEIQKQVQALARQQEIAWWAVTPEELRPWERGEMDYLATVCEVIRHEDSRHRPVYLYNPNHRDGRTLAPVAKQVELVAKGAYVNYTGHKRDRAWVRWSVEQELEAIRTTGRSGAVALLNPELCRDPEPSEDGEIRAWVRHDVYLGLASGAKGVVIWSLYPRKEVQRTWQLWYDAYAECGRELNGPRGLAQVFLFGQRRTDLKVNLVSGEQTARVTLGGEVEPATTSSQERAAREIKLPTWTAAEFAWGDSRWLFLVNSANSSAEFSVNGWPVGSHAENAFDGMAVMLPEGGALTLALPAYGVVALRFQQSAPGSVERH
jgi:hypothetical protein